MTDTIPNVDDFLEGFGGAPAAAFPEKGTVVKGRIEHLEVVQQRDFVTGEPKVYADTGKPMLQLVITVATDLRDPEIEDDDGQRRIFARGQMLVAVKEAAKKANAKLRPGGTLAVQFYDEKPSEKRGFNPQKLYRAQYQPPTQNAEVDDLLGDNAPTSSQPAAADLL